MNDLERATLSWRKSSYSNGVGGECVEVAVTRDRLLLRDSKHLDGPILTLKRTALHALLGELRTNTH